MVGKTKKVLSVEQRFIQDVRKENESLNKKIDKLKKTIGVFETKIKVNNEFLERQGNKEPDNIE